MIDNYKETNVQIKSNDSILVLFGNFDENIKIIENELKVKILNRDNEIKITGEAKDVEMASNIINRVIDLINKGEEVNKHTIEYITSLIKNKEDSIADNFITDSICITSRGKPIKSKTEGQRKYIEAIKRNDVVFGIGPAGTGKTFLAIAMAVAFLKNKKVNRIILTRPAVEAGERLGFLPGDLQDKIDPYLRPLYDALYDIIGIETFQKYIENGIIEVAPLAYMRGRTLDDSFIILDEAQNTTPEQMKMLLTRFGFGSRVVVTGDITQIDLSKDKQSGLVHVTKVLKNIEGIEFSYLSHKDVVRHKLVMEIIKAYERNEEN